MGKGEVVAGGLFKFNGSAAGTRLGGGRVQWLGHHPNLRRLALVGEVVVHWLPEEQVE